MGESGKPLLEFPCRFPLKVMGDRHEFFVPALMETVRQYAPDLVEADVILRESSSGRYQSITITVNAISQEQLDSIYRALTGHDMVKVVL